MQAKVWRYLSITWGMGLHLLAWCCMKAGMHSLFFIYAYEISVRDWGICAYDMFFLAGNGRLEAEGNVQSSGLGSILEWVRLAWP
jgi:hypothetical protein